MFYIQLWQQHKQSQPVLSEASTTDQLSTPSIQHKR